NRFSRWKYERPTAFIAISDKIKEVLIASGIPASKISVIKSGVDFDRYKNVTPARKSVFKVRDESFIVGQIAALAPHKDQSTFLKAVALLRDEWPDLHVVIVGDGPLRKELVRLQRDLKLTGIVDFLGFEENPLPFLAAFDIFCLSSKEEGLGTSLIDAM